jgi:hypothetical protein
MIQRAYLTSQKSPTIATQKLNGYFTTRENGRREESRAKSNKELQHIKTEHKIWTNSVDESDHPSFKWWVEDYKNTYDNFKSFVDLRLKLRNGNYGFLNKRLMC